MHIKRLRFSNFKGRDADLHLDQVTVITGDNFAGKSAVPIALRLALTGYLPPPIGKMAGAIYGLAGDSERVGAMSVEVETDTGRTSKLTYTRSAKGKVSCDGGVPADLALPGLLVEPATFFGLTSAQRVQAVFEACDPVRIGVTVGDLTARLSGIQAMPRKDAEECIANLAADAKERFVKFGVPAALSDLEADWKDDLKGAKNRHTAETGVLASLANISRDRPGFDAAKLAALKAEESKLRQEEPDNKAFIKARSAESAAAAKLSAAEASLAEAEHALSEFDDLEACPTCGAHAKGWKDAVAKTLQDAVAGHRDTVRSLELASRLAADEVDHQEKEFERQHTAWREKHDANAKQIVELLAKKGEDDAWQRNIKTRDEAEVRVLRFAAQVEVYKQAVEIVRELREAAVERVFGDVLKVARGFTDDLLNSPIEWRDGEIGRRVSQADKDDGNTAPVGSWITHEAFSGTEQLLAYAGFAVALSQQAPIKLVIMDELGRLTVQRRVQLLARMRKLVETGVIDQFVGCDVEALDGTAAKYVTL